MNSENAKARPHREILNPHPDLWEALERGPKLRRILEAFYAKVYHDARLGPFFEKTSLEWAIDHQYAFLGQVFSGDKMFFGDRPRNAHHWMVISDALFDYREELMMATLAEFNLSEAQRCEWREVEEAFRHHIVKDAPRPLRRRGVAFGLEGFASVELSSGGACDDCDHLFDVGGRGDYHVRTGRLYCPDCLEREKARGRMAAELKDERK